MSGKDNGSNRPENFDGQLPSSDDFARAVTNALADEISFILLHEDDSPNLIIERMPRMLERMRAVITLKGPHQARAIRLLLQLRPRYLAASYRLKQWGDLLMFALSIARDLEDEALHGEVIRSWGLYHAIYYDTARATVAFNWSTSKLRAVADANSELLRRIDTFNVGILSMEPEEVATTAKALYADVRKLPGRYFPGRICHSLARYFASRDDAEKAFMYGQQALCYYWEDPEAWQELIAQVMLTMIAVLRIKDLNTEQHQRRILKQLDQIMLHKVVNPMVTAKVLHAHAIQHYHLGNYDEAKQLILKAAIQYKLVSDRDGWARAQHIWGQAQRGLGHWIQAERHLLAAANLYHKLNNNELYVLAQLSYALVPYEQEDWQGAYTRLSQTRKLAEQMSVNSGAQKRRIDEIDGYLAEVRAHIDIVE